MPLLSFAAPHVRSTRASQAVRPKRGEPTGERADGVRRDFGQGCPTIDERRQGESPQVINFCYLKMT
jgi:hypothetical protein